MSLDFAPTKTLPFTKVKKDARDGKLHGLKYVGSPRGMPKGLDSFRLDKGDTTALFCYKDDNGDIFCTGYGITGFPGKENRCDKIVLQLSNFYKVKFEDENDQEVDKQYVKLADALNEEESYPEKSLNQLTGKKKQTPDFVTKPAKTPTQGKSAPGTKQKQKTALPRKKPNDPLDDLLRMI